MSRPPFAHLAGNLSGWPKGTVPTPAILRRLDQYSSELVNGEEGGAWAPEDPIVIGQSTIAGYASEPEVLLNSVGCVLSGDIETVKGNGLGVDIEPRPGLLMTGTEPPFQSNRSRTIIVPFTAWADLEKTSNITANAIPHDAFGIDPVTMCVMALTAASAQVLTFILPVSAQHHSATIAQVTFRYAIANQRGALPGQMPRFRVVRFDATTLASLHTAAGAYDANGWYTDQAANAVDYYNQGNTRTAVYVPNQNNTSLNPEAYYYAAQIINESGANADGKGNVFLSAEFSLTTIANLKPE